MQYKFKNIKIVNVKFIRNYLNFHELLYKIFVLFPTDEIGKDAVRLSAVAGAQQNK